MAQVDQKLVLAEFAAAALSGGLNQGAESSYGSVTPQSQNWIHPPEDLAVRAFAIAQAMLAELEKQVIIDALPAKPTAKS